MIRGNKTPSAEKQAVQTTGQTSQGGRHIQRVLEKAGYRRGYYWKGVWQI